MYKANISTFTRPLFMVMFGLAVYTTFAEALIDPTQPPGMGSASVQKAKGVSRWVLNSTLISGLRRIANINGKAVSVGDLINGATVSRIEASYVELTMNNSERIITVSLLPKDFKRFAQGESHDSP